MDDVAGIYARESTYLDRYVQIALAQGRVISVSFPTEPESDAGTEHALLDRIEAYLGGERDAFEDVQVALTVPTDQRAVLDAVQRVPYGESATVDQLARLTPGRDPDGDHAGIRAAVADNPAPLLIPTHRVRDAAGSEPAAVAERLRAVEGL
jgi:methylated-DNA-[protein]-cysteine S-methyltransferase